MLARARVVELAARPEELVRRAGRLSGRPLLDGAADPVARARELLAARAPLYARAHVHIDTEGKSPEAVAGEIAAALGKEAAP
jgi:shikimate kinase